MKKLTVTAIAAGFLAATAFGAEEESVRNFAPMEEIVVTAQKRQQSLMDVGISVSVADEQQIRDRRINVVQDIQLFTPNAHVKEIISGLMPIITVRGVGLNDFNAANNPAVGVYIDEVSLSSLALLSSDFFDLERMEVLKGPQGTLYGRNSTAGALNIVTAKPAMDETSARLSAGAGDYDLLEVEGMVNLPLAESAALRLSGKVIDQGEGFWENTTTGNDDGERDVWMARAQLLWEPSDQTSVLFKIENQEARSELGTYEFFGALPSPHASDCPGNPACMNFLGFSDTDGDIYTVASGADPTYDLDQFISTLRIDSELGFATLTAITGYINFDRIWTADVDASPARILDFYNSDDVEQISQEVRLAGETEAMIWQLGAFFTNDKVTTVYRGDLQDLLNTTSDSLGDLDSTNISAFANFEWNLSERLALITGVRVSNEERDAVVYTDDLATEFPASFLSLTPVGAGPVRLAFIDDTVKDTSVDWKVGLNWDINEATLLYASVSKGTKSGGFFTGVVTTNAQLLPYDEEELIAYEVGVKGRLSSASLIYESAAFYYDYDDVQTFIGDNSGAVPVNRLGNVEGATIYGFDGQVMWGPPGADGLSLVWGVGLLDTELSSFTSGADVIPKGNEQPDAPGFSTSMALSYSFSFSDAVSAEVAVDGRYQVETFHNALNEPLSESDDYWVINARLSLYLPNDWEATAWSKNIADEDYMIQMSNNLALGNGARVYGPPRTFGVSVTKHLN